MAELEETAGFETAINSAVQPSALRETSASVQSCRIDGGNLQMRRVTNAMIEAVIKGRIRLGDYWPEFLSRA